MLPVAGAEPDESSGSSGRPYTWVRSEAELEQVRRKLAVMVRHLLAGEPDDGRPA